MTGRDRRPAQARTGHAPEPTTSEMTASEMTTPGDDRPAGQTDRRPWSWPRTLLVLTVLLAVVALVGLSVHAWVGGDEDAQATVPADPGTTAQAQADAVGTPAPATADVAASAAPDPGTTPSPGPRTDDKGFAHSDVVGDGTWTLTDPVPPSQPGAATVYRYVLRVEGGTGVDGAAAAATIQGVLNDDRGWRTVEGVSFEQVSDPDMADFTLSIASPPMVDTLCAPLQTISMWNCRNGDNVVLNSDRWSYGSPTFPDVDSYRIYVINHEVGHFLGHEHEFCAGPGLKSPTMAQQSRTREGGCTANGWPTQDNQAS